MKRFFQCLLATFGLTTACGQQNFETTDVRGFSLLTDNPNVVILDVRTASEYAEGHIEGAIHLDQGQSDFVEQAKAQLPSAARPALPNAWQPSATLASASTEASTPGKRPTCP